MDLLEEMAINLDTMSIGDEKISTMNSETPLMVVKSSLGHGLFQGWSDVSFEGLSYASTSENLIPSELGSSQNLDFSYSNSPSHHFDQEGNNPSDSWYTPAVDLSDCYTPSVAFDDMGYGFFYDLMQLNYSSSETNATSVSDTLFAANSDSSNESPTMISSIVNGSQQQVERSKMSRGGKAKSARRDTRRQRNKITKPAVCKECGKGHTDKGELNRHIKVHHPGKAKFHGINTERYKCPSCRKTFSRVDNRTRHLAKQHGN